MKYFSIFTGLVLVTFCTSYYLDSQKKGGVPSTLNQKIKQQESKNKDSSVFQVTQSQNDWINLVDEVVIVKKELSVSKKEIAILKKEIDSLQKFKKEIDSFREGVDYF